MTMAPASPPPLEAPPPDLLPAPPRETILTRVKLLLRPQNFIAAVPGPIFHRDVWISGRKSGTYWIRCVYVLMLTGVIALLFAGAASDIDSASSPALRLQSLQTVAPLATKTILWFQLCALTFAGAIFGAPAICDEKRAGTLATLLTTPLKAWQIVMGKTCAFFVQLMILTLVAMPLLLAVRVFGGVSAREIFAGTALSLSTALLAGLSALWYSIRARRTPHAMSAGFVHLLVLQGIVPLLWAIYAWQYNTPGPFEYLVYACTPAAMACVTFGYEMGNPPFVQNAWIYATLWTLAWCAIMFVAASFRLRAVMVLEGAGGSPIPKAKKVKSRKGKAAPEPPTDPAAATDDPAAPPADPTAPDIKRRKRASSVQEGVTRTVSDHPVLWREVRQATFRSKALLYATVALAAVGMGALYLKFGFDEEPMHYVFGVIGMILALLTAAVTPAAVVSGEREARTWEVLLTTPLTAWSIMIGKVAGAVRRQWLVPAILGVHFTLAVLSVVFYARFPVSPLIWIWLPLVYVPPVLFLNATGSLLSMLCRKSAAAAAANFGVALFLWAILPGLVGFTLFGLLKGGQGADDFFSLFMVSNPVALMAVALRGAVDNHYDLFDFDNHLPGFVVALAVYAAVYLGGALLILKAAAGILAAKTMRLK